MKTVEELEALVETVTRERDLSLFAWESAGMQGRDAQSAMLELARQLEEARAIVGSCWLTYSEGERDKARAWAHQCERERDEARETIVALTTAKAEADLEIATLTAALDERDLEAERSLEQYDRLVRERDDLCAWQVQIAEPLGYLVRAFGVGGYDVAEPSVIMEAWRALERERDEARAEAERDAYARSHLILKAIHGALTDALPSTPIPALDSFDVVDVVRNIVAECERMKTFAAQNFSQMIRQEAEQMRAYGLSYEGVRKVLHEYNDGEISFGKLMDLLRSAARAMAEDMKK